MTSTLPHIRTSIGRTFFLYIFCLSLLIMTIITIVSLYGDYRNGIRDVETQLQEIEAVHLKSLTESVWNFSETLIMIQLKGLLSISDVEYVEIRLKNGQVLVSGIYPASYIIKRQFLLEYENDEKKFTLGVLVISASFKRIHDKFVRQIFITTITTLLSSVLISGLVYLLFYRLVGKHLQVLAHYVRNIDIQRTDISCRLNRGETDGIDDELTQLTNAINTMCFRLNTTMQALQEKTVELDRFFTVALDLLCIADTDGYFRRVNPAWEHSLGYSLDELTGKRFLDFVHPDDIDRTLHVISQLRSQQDVVDFVNRYRCKDGAFRWIEWRSAPAGKLIYAAARDISDRKHTEAVLRENELRLRAIIDNTDAGYFFIDREGILRDVNPAWLKLYRYSSAEEVLGQHFTIIQKIEDIESAKEVVAGIIRKDAKYLTGEFSRKCKDGAIGYHSFSARPVFHAGEAIGIEGFIIDTTERKRAEEALQDSEKRFRALFESMTEGVALHEVIYNAQGTPVDYLILNVNPAFSSHTGIAVQDAVGSKASDLYGTETPPYFDLYTQVAATGVPARFEVYFEPMHKYFTISVFSPGKGQFATVFKDITERKQMEETLRRSEERFYKAFHASGVAMSLTNLEDNTLLDVNTEFLKLTGCSREEVLGHTTEELNLWVNPEQRIAILARLDKDGFVRNQEYEVRSKAGQIRMLLGNAEKLTIHNHAYLLSSAYDITDRKLVERKIRTLNAELEQRVQERTAKLETANKELNDVVYAASHDLKTPLRGISQLAYWLVQNYMTAFDEQGKEMVTLLINRVKRLDRLLDGLLEYADAGRIAEHAEAIDVTTVVNDAIYKLAPLPPTISVEIQHDLPVVMGDKKRLEQVFLHVIGNAMKFLDKCEGKITISWMEDDAQWTFSVADNGPGIDAKYQQKIFQLFQTLTPRDVQENIGVGLAVVKKIIDFYGGQVWVESTIGKGSTFFFTFPKQGQNC